MIRAMIAGERDPQALAALAGGRMKARHSDLVEALDGMFGDHHGELAQMLPGQIDFPDDRIGALTPRPGPITAPGPGPLPRAQLRFPIFRSVRVPGDLPTRNPRANS